jgi:alpha-D-xyloside xylohydrolase
VGLRLLPIEGPLRFARRDSEDRATLSREHIPLDAIVQDWFWWKNEGDPEFNANYHDVPRISKTLHKENVHTMISVWGLLDPKSETYKTLDAHRAHGSRRARLRPSKPEARDIYWNRLPGKLLRAGMGRLLAR